MEPLRSPRTRAAVLATVLLVAASALGASVYMSRTVERNIQLDQPAVHLSVGGVPPTASAGDIFRVTAFLKNNANRPTPAVLRLELRSDYSLKPSDATVFGTCGAEEQVSSRALIYYLGDHGPLLAPNGTSFSAGTTAAAVEAFLGDGGHWEAVLREVMVRDPQGYASLVDPGTNASAGVRGSTSLALKTLYYYGAVEAADPSNPDPGAWWLSVDFRDVFVVGGEGGFDVEIGFEARGNLTLRFWAERPDGLGVPNHPWQCGPL